MFDPTDPYTPMDVNEYRALREAGTPHLLVDVREVYEYEEARIPGSVLMPLDEIMHRADELADHQTIVLVCRSGGRSAMAAFGLRDAGLTEHTLYNLEGGVMAWVQDGHPYDSGPEGQ